MKYKILYFETKEYLYNINYCNDEKILIYCNDYSKPLILSSLSLARFILIHDRYKYNNKGKFKIVPEN